jgi:hypothetical protein
LPGSYYTRIFPSESVHLFHSLFCLQWRSQVCICMLARRCSSHSHTSLYFTPGLSIIW